LKGPDPCGIEAYMDVYLCALVTRCGVNCCALFQGKLGELLLSLCYQTSLGAISVEIIEARGLKAMDINGFSGKND